MCREDKEDSVQMSERERFDLVVMKQHLRPRASG